MMIMNTSGNLSENREVKTISISDGNWYNSLQLVFWSSQRFKKFVFYFQPLPPSSKRAKGAGLARPASFCSDPQVWTLIQLFCVYLYLVGKVAMMIMNTSGNLSENHEVKIISISDGNWYNSLQLGFWTSHLGQALVCLKQIRFQKKVKALLFVSNFGLAFVLTNRLKAYKIVWVSKPPMTEQDHLISRHGYPSWSSESPWRGQGPWRT